MMYVMMHAMSDEHTRLLQEAYESGRSVIFCHGKLENMRNGSCILCDRCTREASYTALVCVIYSLPLDVDNSVEVPVCDDCFYESPIISDDHALHNSVISVEGDKLLLQVYSTAYYCYEDETDYIESEGENSVG